MFAFLSKKHNFGFVFFLLLWSFSSHGTLAASEIPHRTIISNQVRGTECCSPGSKEYFEQQQATLSKFSLGATFTLRYDALIDQSFIEQAHRYPEFEYGGLLEVTPSLAQAAEVPYLGSEEQWYEAQYVFLVGYSKPERKQLIDTYMEQFLEVFGTYPRTTTAWMIDPISLAYLKEKYGAQVHQITREQFGTDSYTLYGGPPHYPYWPSTNWALVPAADDLRKTPLIIRQTITDPVFNYGDQTNSYTSQPNDYLLRNDTTTYFTHLFEQAHTQEALNGYTFALIGLENSLPENVQQEYIRQLNYVKEWKDKSPQNTVNSTATFTDWLTDQNFAPLTVYSGSGIKDATEKAWWITTQQYRARVRLSNRTLVISDLRIFDSNFTDPYLSQRAHSLGWWIVPFALDGSRNTTTQEGLAARNDILKDRPTSFFEPNFWIVATNIQDIETSFQNGTYTFLEKGTPLLSFSERNVRVTSTQTLPNQSQPLSKLKWEKNAWGFEQNDVQFAPFSESLFLGRARKKHADLLFPEVQVAPPAEQTTGLYINNQYAIADRNPSRLVLFPRDEDQKSVLLSSPPQVTTSSQDIAVTVARAHGSNGMIFIDLESDQPQTGTVTIQVADFEKVAQVYFAPHCSSIPQYCLTHPKESYWFLRSYIDDKLRLVNEKKQRAEQTL